MNILYVGYAVNPNIIDELSGASVAGNKMQINILYEMKRQGINVTALTIYPLAPFPKEKKVLVKRKLIDLGMGIESVSIPYINIPFIKQLSQIVSVYHEAYRILKENNGIDVLTFNMFPQVGTPIRLLKKRFKINVCSILADLPIDDKNSRNVVSRIFRDLFDSETIKNIKVVDKLVVLNENAQKKYAPNTKYIVVDGGINIEDYIERKQENTIKQPSDEKKHLVYGGALTRYSGVIELIEAMKSVEESVQLDIYGKGDMEKYISNLNDARVVFHGSVNNAEMLKVQKSAWVLINPRPVNDPISRVTFPSKIFEYLMSGRPSIITKIDGMDENYKSCFLIAENNSPKELARVINEAYMMDGYKLEQIGRYAKEYGINNKSWRVQTSRIIKFLEE